MAATITLQRARAVKTISGNPPQVLMLPESNSLPAKAGEFVYLASGLVTEIADNAILICGMLAADGSNVSTAATLGTKVPVYVANEDTIFEANAVSNDTFSGTAGTAVATAVTHVGATAGLYRDTTNNITHVRAGSTYGAHSVRIIGISDSDTLADVGGRLYFQVMPKYRQLFCTS